MKIESTLAKIAENVFSATDFITARTMFIEHVSATNIKDKIKMIDAVNKLKNLLALQRYCANSLLKYEGLGLTTTKPDKTNKSDDTAEQQLD